jgi:predicted AlkP superfamily pyrophosphatase or phosphodiesterase
MRDLLLGTVTGAVLSLAAWPQGEPGMSAARPSLVLLLTVDQLRPEYLEDYRPQLTGGLGRLLVRGAVFTNAHQDHAVTETAPGHASILSGRFPRSTGIIANDGGVPDPASPLIDTDGEGDGASPFRFRGTTLADWMHARDPGTRTLSVSRKDRGAILPFGRFKGPAYWYAAGRFTTSRYYADTLPTWVKEFNAARLPRRYAGAVWDLLLPAGNYKEPDSVAVEGLGRAFLFPHRISTDSARAAALLPNYPMMDELTLQFALRGVEANGLGHEAGRTDLLAISLSSTDAVGHLYGPDSREIHDQVVRLDRYLGNFFDSLYRIVDSNRVVVVLTADHGVAPFPHAEVRSRFRRGEANAGYVDIRPVAAATWRGLIAAGVDSAAFGWDREVLYLRPEPFVRARVNRDSVARAYAKAVAMVDGVLRADLVSELWRKRDRRDPIARRWLNTIPADAPAAVVVTLRPFWYWPGDRLAQHGSPHDYDTHVPLIFAGAGFATRRGNEFARVVDIAPTLAALLGITPPEPLDGVVLNRALVRP